MQTVIESSTYSGDSLLYDPEFLPAYVRPDDHYQAVTLTLLDEWRDRA
jgi:hypothetical protein